MSCETRPGPAMLGAAAFTSAGIKLGRGGILSRIGQWRIAQLIGPRRIRPSRECRLNNIFETCNLPAIRFELMIGSAHHAPRGMGRNSVHPTRVGRCAIKKSEQPMGETDLNFSPTSGSDRFPPPVADARRAAERPLGGSHLQSAIWLQGRGHDSIRVQRAPPPSRPCTQRVGPYFLEHGQRTNFVAIGALTSQSTPLTGLGLPVTRRKYASEQLIGFLRPTNDEGVFTFGCAHDGRE